MLRPQPHALRDLTPSQGTNDLVPEVSGHRQKLIGDCNEWAIFTARIRDRDLWQQIWQALRAWCATKKKNRAIHSTVGTPKYQRDFAMKSNHLEGRWACIPPNVSVCGEPRPHLRG